MEPTARLRAADLSAQLGPEIWRYSFFQLVELVERLFPEAAPVGREGPAGREALRFRPTLSMAFPRADVQRIDVETDSWGTERLAVEVAFLGLYGSVSPLPNHYTEDLLHEADDQSLVRGFLDLFHHRLISLFFRIHKKYRHYLQFKPDGRDEFTHRLFHLIGLGIVSPPPDATVTPLAFLRYAGMLMRRPAPAVNLAAVLTDLFQVPAAITPCVLREVVLPPETRSRLGAANVRLGEDAVLGSRVPDRAGRFRITLGPLGLSEFFHFMPGREGARAVAEVVPMMAGAALDSELELVLEKEEAPPPRLADPALRLGWTTWLGHPAEDGHVLFRERNL